MKNIALSLVLAAFLAACGGDSNETNPVSGGPLAAGGDINGDAASTNDIPDALAVNLQAAVFNGDTETLILSINSLDDGTFSSSYVRNPGLDTNGYLAFSVQDDPLDRFFLALAGTSDNERVSAVVVSDGGQFNVSFGGGSYAQDGSLVLPTNGLVSYAGQYAAVTDTGLENSELLTAPASAPLIIRPSQGSRLQGDIFLNVDFADNAVNGAIFNRVWADPVNNGFALTDVILTDGTIATDGTFNGTTAAVNGQANTDIAGTFGGTFGGNGATDVAGITRLTTFSSDLDEDDEYGLFVLKQCGLAGASSVCSGTGN